MLFMNEWEIEASLARFDSAATPNLHKAAIVLDNLKDWANRNSDGWCYWPKPCRSAKSLMTLLADADRFNPVDCTDADLKRAFSPIKALLTKQGADHAEVFTTEVAA